MQQRQRPKTNTERSQKFQKSWSTQKEIGFIISQLKKFVDMPDKVIFLKKYQQAMSNRKIWDTLDPISISLFVGKKLRTFSVRG